MARRRTLRGQLTLLYAGPFLVTAAALLAFVPLLSIRDTVPAADMPPQPPTAVENGSRALGLSAAAFVVTVLVSIVVGWIVAGRFLRPLRLMIDTARDISATNLHRRLGPTGRRDEFAELASTLDDLFGRLEAAFAAQRRFVANASHELRTPLTAQRALLQVALADPDASTESVRAAAREVLDLGAGQARLIDALLTLATGEQGIERPDRFDLAPVAGRVVASRAAAASGRGITVTTDLSPVPIAGDESLAGSLVANLVDNALRHNVDGGRIAVTTAGSALTVANTGPVVPPDQVERLFQPFQRLGADRVRAASDGHGLGLAIVRAIAQAHGATVAAAAPPEGGLRVTVTFP
ncbi:sensor histidine kinase [Dactylosporangium sp. CA-092794]|uniref:sensor histidine kinase n=1 Tax=Dactylosporangium sp. CA-092794 TaxID=3239929 RepID=UPI003D91F8DC